MTKQITIKFSVLVVAFVTAKLASATPTALSIETEIYSLSSLGDIHNPLDYTISDSFVYYLDCPGTGSLCAIEVKNDEIYTVWDDPYGLYTGKPKVGIGSLASDINAAMASTLDPYITPTGRRIWKKHY